MTYVPSKKILVNYAKVLTKFALWSGKGIKSGDVVLLTANEISKPLYVAVRNAILESGGHVISNYLPDGNDRYQIGRDFYMRAKSHQLDFFPAKYMKGLIDEIDHFVYLIADSDPHELEDIDPKKIMRKGKVYKQYMDWRKEKENKGKFSWTLCLYGTKAMAKEAGMSERAYWNQIIKACFLDEKDPVKKWRQVQSEIEKYRKRLNAVTKQTEKFHVVGPDVDLWITPGEKRQWLGGTGANIPSFEIFTSPDWRGTEGWIRFNQPLYRYGNLIEGVELEFKNGKVVKSRAKKNDKVLKAMIATPGADRVGEFSLTDKRHSRITKFMAETLFDENIGGANGNTHIALGSAYEESYSGDVSKLSKSQSKRLGFNDSSVHTDIISTAPRTVTAHLKNGSEKVIYKNGMFTL
jgi:aminopeptidase